LPEIRCQACLSPPCLAAYSPPFFVYTAPMPISLKARLCLMMFLNYVIWGAWYVTITAYLMKTLNFSGTEAGAVFGTAALASMISPFFIGLVADRFFATEKVLAVLHLMGAGLLFCVTQATGFASVYVLMLLYCLCFFPTIGLTNSLTLRQLTDAGGQFPFIRMFATIGWIAIGVTISYLNVQESATQFLLAAGMSLAMSAFCLTLPHTPPAGKGQKITARSLLGLDALVMLKKRPYLVFVVASVLACIPLTFYFVFTAKYLVEVGVANVAGTMTLGQLSEVGVMLLMPLIFRKITVRGVFILGLACWSLRYGLLAFGNAGAAVWMFYLAILLHGFCFDFFFMTGQLYTDQEAPPHLRGTAQGFLTFLTYGVGMFIGSMLSGVALDYFTTTESGGAVKHNWTSFWIVCGGGAAVILVLVALFFQTRAKIETKAA
jgi:nucleoside transporter